MKKFWIFALFVHLSAGLFALETSLSVGYELKSQSQTLMTSFGFSLDEWTIHPQVGVSFTPLVDLSEFSEGDVTALWTPGLTAGLSLEWGALGWGDFSLPLEVLARWNWGQETLVDPSLEAQGRLGLAWHISGWAVKTGGFVSLPISRSGVFFALSRGSLD